VIANIAVIRSESFYRNGHKGRNGGKVSDDQLSKKRQNRLLLVPGGGVEPPRGVNLGGF
jgi:hypothetical protein